MKKRCVPRGLLIYALCSLACLLFLLLCRGVPALAESWSRGGGALVRFLLALLSSPFPFSLFEILVFLFALFCLFLVGFSLYCGVRRWRKGAVSPLLGRLWAIFFAVLLGVSDLFCLGFGPAYFRFSLTEQLNLEPEIRAEEVMATFRALSLILNEAVPKIEKNDKGETLPPASLSEIGRAVNEAADAFGEKYPFYQKRGLPAKRFLSSPLMTYTHISGVYGFFTGEANVNTNYPHFIVTATLAHESCHARGIAPENECNTLAAFLLMESPDPYLRYCGALFLFDDFYAAAKKIDKEEATEIYKGTDPAVARDFAAYSKFFEPYRHSTASKVADKANSAYLQSMGQEAGTLSYSMVISLTVGMMKEQNRIG